MKLLRPPQHSYHIRTMLHHNDHTHSYTIHTTEAVETTPPFTPHWDHAVPLWSYTQLHHAHYWNCWDHPTIHTTLGSCCTIMIIHTVTPHTLLKLLRPPHHWYHIGIVLHHNDHTHSYTIHTTESVETSHHLNNTGTMLHHYGHTHSYAHTHYWSCWDHSTIHTTLE